MEVTVNGFSHTFLKYVSPFITPIVEAFHEMYAQVAVKVMNNLLWGAFRHAIFDPDSKWDWVALLLTIVGSVVAAKGTFGLSLKMGGSALVTWFTLRVLPKLGSTIYKIARISKVASIGNKGYKALNKTAKALEPIARKLPKNYNEYKKLRKELKGSFGRVEKIYNIIDLMDVTKEDVEEYKTMFTEKSRKIGEDFDRASRDFGKNV